MQLLPQQHVIRFLKAVQGKKFRLECNLCFVLAFGGTAAPVAAEPNVNLVVCKCREGGGYREGYRGGPEGGGGGFGRGGGSGGDKASCCPLPFPPALAFPMPGLTFVSCSCLAHCFCAAFDQAPQQLPNLLFGNA